MELCTTALAVSRLPHQRPFDLNHTNLPWKKFSLPLTQTSVSRNNRGSLYYINSSLKSTTSEETSSGASQYVKEEPDGVMTMDEVRSVEKSAYGESEDETQPFDLFDKLNIKLDSEDSFAVLLFGGGGLAVLWLATAVVGAFDSIPVFPKLMEVVGLGYTLWFCTRYLLFKKNRDELAAKVEEIKQQVVGSKDD